MKRYLFTFMLLITMLAAGPYVLGKMFPEFIRLPHLGEKDVTDMVIVEVESVSEETKETLPEMTQVEETEEIIETETVPSLETTGTDDNTVSQNEAEVPWVPDLSYFDDALFIGDSRTIGLFEYSNLGNAAFYANTGMSVYKLFSLKNAIIPSKNDERKMLSEMLEENVYGKIYIMLGINELGYNFDTTIAKYKEEVLKIMEIQPEAIIYLQANLHVTEKRSKKDAVYNNEKINRFNGAVKAIAEELNLYYLDANALFDDETGSLRADYTYDEVHLLGKYYQQWADWILAQAVKTE